MTLQETLCLLPYSFLKLKNGHRGVEAESQNRAHVGFIAVIVISSYCVTDIGQDTAALKDLSV